jgi:hypothetical protein
MSRKSEAVHPYISLLHPMSRLKKKISTGVGSDFGGLDDLD